MGLVSPSVHCLSMLLVFFCRGIALLVDSRSWREARHRRRVQSCTRWSVDREGISHGGRKSKGVIASSRPGLFSLTIPEYAGGGKRYRQAVSGEERLYYYYSFFFLFLDRLESTAAAVVPHATTTGV